MGLFTELRTMDIFSGKDVEKIALGTEARPRKVRLRPVKHSEEQNVRDVLVVGEAGFIPEGQKLDSILFLLSTIDHPLDSKVRYFRLKERPRELLDHSRLAPAVLSAFPFFKVFAVGLVLEREQQNRIGLWVLADLLERPLRGLGKVAADGITT